MKRGRFDYLETMVGKPPEGWTLDITPLRETPGEVMCVVECWLRSCLAVHEVEILTNDGNGVPNTRVRIGRLTHRPTGLRIIDCLSLDDAVMAAELIENAAVWKDVKYGQQGIWPTVKARIERLFVADTKIVEWMTVYRPQEAA